MREVRRTLLLAVLAVAVVGCGSGGSTSGAVIRAASDTSSAAGYRIAGIVTIATPTAGTISEALSGSFDRTDQLGAINTVASLAGHSFRISELISKLTVYMGANAIPHGIALTGGKPWIKIDTSRAIGALGISALPTATDPTQFVDYLRAVSSSTVAGKIGVIRGVAAQQYHAIVGLDRYPNLVPPAQRPAVMRSVKTLESVLGSHKLPIDVWVDVHGLVRRLSLAFNECVSRTHFNFGLTMDLYDYGTQPRPAIPRPNQVDDVTSVITSSLRHAKLACS